MNLAYREYPSFNRGELNLSLYRRLFLIRAAENAIQKYYHEDDMKTPMHMSMGEEAIIVGVCEALGPQGQVFGTYRSHALYLAKTGETDGFFAEMYGKVTGVARGKAGSMHMSAPESGLLCCAAIVASTIPLAMGAAFANKMQRTGRIVAVFLGDGAMDAGVFWETLNGACLMKLPIMFVCEDNDFAVHTRRRYRHGFRSATDVVAQFDCSVHQTDSTDAEEIYRITQEALTDMHVTGRPAFLNCKWYRYLEHVGINEDFDAGYRSKDEYFSWKKRDPVSLQRGKLLQDGLAESMIKTIEERICSQIENSVARAKMAPPAGREELYSGLFA
jgi:acetoin:2,6-dichlorophenolindophenol oxidoreductase subunit alpha